MSINVLSLFDGMSCGRLALERAGIPINKYYASELDKYAIQIAQKNYPDTIQLGDVRNVKGRELPRIDLLIGGSPCQGFSFAGKQLNFKDPRSALFFEFVRLLKDTKPAYFLLENVVMKKEYQNIISDYLGVEPVMINSALVSAQNRKRLYWANFAITQPEDRGIVLRDVLEPKGSGKTLSERSRSAARTIKNIRYGDQKSKCLLAAMYKGAGANGLTIIAEGDRVRCITPIECERLQTLPDNYTAGVSDSQRYRMIGNGWTGDAIAHIFKCMLKDDLC